MNDALQRYRDRIDAIDDEILKLVNQRAECACAIGELKEDGQVYRAEREAQILRRVKENNPGPLSEAAALNMFAELMSACRALEKNLSVAYLGPAGTFSEQAARKHFGSQMQTTLCASIDEVFRTIEAGTAAYGVVPVENSSEGAVGRTLDLLLARPLQICGEITLPVHQCLLAGSAGAIRKIVSHAQSLAQCNEWLNRHYPEAERIPVVSNAEAARIAGFEEDTAAIAAKSAASLYQLQVIAENIEDVPNNTTRFLVISLHDALPSGKDRTSLVMSAENRPGAVHALLTPLAEHQVSMSRFESRPSRASAWEYVFFVDIEGHRQDAQIERALAALREKAVFVKILGSYPQAI